MDRVGARERRRADAGVVRRPAEGLGDEVDGLERIGPLVDPVAQLSGTDQHRCAGIDHELLQQGRTTT